MADLRFGIVTFKDQRVGTLAELPGGGTVFRYDHADGPEIACALPAGGQEHVCDHGLHPFFAHLAPEGWLRDRQAAYADVDKDDDLGILLAFGADCIGAVGVVDPSHSHDRVRLKQIGQPIDAAAVRHERTVSGVQAKVLCSEAGGGVVPAAADGPAPLIAKFAGAGLPDMVANEMTTLELCRILLGADEVADATLRPVQGLDGLPLVVRRFDRAGPAKLRCEDFAQVIAQPPGRDHRGKYAVGYDALGRALAHSAARLLDTRRAFKRLAAYVLLGNVDCHLKNWSLLEEPEGLRLAPAYDVINGYIYADAGYTTRFGLLVGDVAVQWERYDRALLLEIAHELGLKRKAAEGVLGELRRAEKPLFGRLQQGLRLDEQRSWAYRATVRTAWERVYG